MISSQRDNSKRKVYFAVGIDWMKPYWLAVELRGENIALRRMSDISEVCGLYEDADAVWIDIPVGIPENGEEFERRPDREARKYLCGKRKSSVFPVPCRQAVYLEDYVRANAENKRVLNRGLTSQSYGFSRMIRQVDEFLLRNPGWKNRLVESHPEVAFQILNHGKGLDYSKHKPEGLEERIHILKMFDVDPSALLTQVAAKQREDVLDALSLAVSAALSCKNGSFTIPQTPSCDSRGLKMQMAFGLLAKKGEDA